MTVLDASAAVELLLNTPRGRRLHARLAADTETLHAPHLADLEIAQVLRRYVLHGNLGEPQARLALARWRSLDVERYAHEPLLGRVWGLRNNMSAYDAVYVALAEALGTVLVTGDRRLAAAPGLNVHVELA
ncbi:MAG: type II toxin-antitoxin system VapC family toxin [Acidobacteria bacterium]|nr:type II toxin-antitoxin system VapC family toxin [Acidobacteriota bacterium]